MQTLVFPTRQPLESIGLHPIKLVAMGDSLVYGFGDTEGGGWVERLRRQWMSPDSPGHAIYNLGIRGDGIAQVAERVEQEFRHRGEMRNRVPDILILSVGVNDSARLGHRQGRNFSNFDVFSAELGNLLERSQKLCQVLFVGMVPVDEPKMPFMDCLYFNLADQYRYKEATKLACQARQIPYLDVFDLWQQRGDNWCQQQLCADGLHPNVSGYRALFQDILAWEPVARLSN